MTQSSGRIWVVEDDVSVQRILVESLKARDFTPTVFDSAEKAYAALRTDEPPSLMILDMMLPGMSGVDLIRLLKQNKAWEKIPVVVVTVLSRRDAPGGAEEMTSAFWINKPFDTGNLMNTIVSILSSART